jgi:hypothetical protein
MNIQATSVANVTYSVGSSRGNYSSGSAGGAGASSGASSPSSSSNSSSSAYYDPKDLNKDGFVSEYEEYIYELTHASESSSSDLSTLYNSQGSLATSNPGTSGIVDIYA